jgi:hypothetical protein
MGPLCHFQGCGALAADVPWPRPGEAPPAPVPLCARHQAQWAALGDPRGEFRDWVVDEFVDAGGHRWVTMRPTRRRERRGSHRILPR